MQPKSVFLQIRADEEAACRGIRCEVIQLRAIDVVVQAETAHDAEAQVRARLRDAPHAPAWLDSATVMRSVIDDAVNLGTRLADLSLGAGTPPN